MRQNLEVLIQMFANVHDLIPPKLDDKDMDIPKALFTDFLRGFNTRQPLSVFEDTNVTGPSSAGGKSDVPPSSLNIRSIANSLINQIHSYDG